MNNKFNDILKEIEAGKINGGINILVKQNNEIIVDKHAGYAYNYDNKKIKMANDTIFDLASNTKIYATGFAIQYILSNKSKFDTESLSLSTKVSEIFKDGFYNDETKALDSRARYTSTGSLVHKNYKFGDIECNQDLRKEITLKNVIEHTTGYGPEVFAFSRELFENDNKTMANGFVDGVKIKFEDIASDSKVSTAIKLLNEYPLINHPGTIYLYSDINYMLLGLIIEKIVKMPLDKFLYEIWSDLGIKLYFQNALNTDNVAATEFNGSERTNHYDKSTTLRKGVVWKQVNDEKAFYLMDGVSGHAGLFGNKYEMMKLLEILATGIYKGKQVISKEVINDFRQECKQNSCQAMCYFKKGINPTVSRNELFGTSMSNKTYGHSGWVGILSSFDEESNTFVVLLTNKKHSRFRDVDKNQCVDDTSNLTNYRNIVDSIIG